MCPNPPMGYLEICLEPFFERIDHYMPIFIQIFVVVFSIALIFNLLTKAWEISKTMKFKEAFIDVTNGVMVTSGFGFFVLMAAGLIMAGCAAQSNDAELFHLSIVGMALFGTVWFAVFSTLTVLMNVILIPLLIRDFMRELREKRKNYLSDGSAGTEGLAR